MDIDVFENIYEVYKPRGILTSVNEKDMVLIFLKSKVTKAQNSSYCLIVRISVEPKFSVSITPDTFSSRRKYLDLLDLYNGKYSRSGQTIRLRDFCACKCLSQYTPEFREELYNKLCKEIVWNPMKQKAIK